MWNIVAICFSPKCQCTRERTVLQLLLPARVFHGLLTGEPALEASKNRSFRGFFWEGKKYPIETKLSGFTVIYFNSLLKFFQKDTCHIMPGTSISPKRLECAFVVRREICRSQFPSETKNPKKILFNKFNKKLKIVEFFTFYWIFSV